MTCDLINAECNDCPFNDDDFCYAFVGREGTCYKVNNFQIRNPNNHEVARKYIWRKKQYDGIVYEQLVIDEGFVQ